MAAEQNYILYIAVHLFFMLEALVVLMSCSLYFSKHSLRERRTKKRKVAMATDENHTFPHMVQIAALALLLFYSLFPHTILSID